MVAGIHGGDEWNTVTLANQLIAYINQYPAVVLDDVTLYILRNLNPDGEIRSHDKYGRLNSNGVDLNRNFPAHWQADWERAGCWNYLPTSSGSEAGSEPETKALMIFLGSHHIEALISYHSAALGIFPGGDPWDEDSVRLAEAIAGVSTYRFPPLDTGCVYTELAPIRVRWKKYPDQIAIKHVERRLIDAQNLQRYRYLFGSVKESWRLSDLGLQFSKKTARNLKVKESELEKTPPMDNAETTWQSREKVRMLGSTAIVLLQSKEADAVSAQEAEAFFRMDDYIVGEARKRKLNRVIGTFRNDPDLGDIVVTLAKKVRER